MSAPGSSPRRTFFRTLLIVGLITLALVVYGALNVGRFLTKEDSIQKADSIAVLAGTRLDRPLEAVDLYQAGYAPSIVLTHETPERALGVAAGCGVTLPGGLCDAAGAEGNERRVRNARDTVRAGKPGPLVDQSRGSPMGVRRRNQARRVRARPGRVTPAQPSDRMLPARGPFADGSSSKLTR